MANVGYPMHLSTPLAERLKSYCSVCTLILAAAVMCTLLITFEPIWATNDDVAMSMVAHGYGGVARSSPNLVFSNVIWGYLIHSLPAVNGIISYSWVTLTTLFLITWAVLHFLIRSEVNPLVSLLVVLLILARPVAFPQFSLNSGILTAAAVLGWCTFSRTKSIAILVISMALAYGGFLIRSMEFFLVLLVSLPLLPWKNLCRDKAFILSTALLLLSILAAWSTNRAAFNGPEWHLFERLQVLRAAFTDFGAMDSVIANPEIAYKHGYSLNDLEIITMWFFADPYTADPVRLSQFLKDLPLVSYFQGNLPSAWSAVRVLSKPEMMHLVLVSGALLLICQRRLRVIACWTCFLLAAALMGIFGRPGLLRVYYPVLCVLAVAPVISVGKRTVGKSIYSCLVIGIGAILALQLLLPENRASIALARQVRNDLAQMDSNTTYFVWGAYLPYEVAYPPLQSEKDHRRLKIYGLGGFTMAPFSAAYSEQAQGRGIIEYLQQGNPIPLIASENELRVLGIYCLEHFHRPLRVDRTLNFTRFSVYFVTCGKD